MIQIKPAAANGNTFTALRAARIFVSESHENKLSVILETKIPATVVAGISA